MPTGVTAPFRSMGFASVIIVGALFALGLPLVYCERRAAQTSVLAL